MLADVLCNFFQPFSGDLESQGKGWWQKVPTDIEKAQHATPWQWKEMLEEMLFLLSSFLFPFSDESEMNMWMAKKAMR